MPFRVDNYGVRLMGIRVRSGKKLDSVQCIYSVGGRQVNGPQNGGDGGTEHLFWLNLSTNEYIVAIGGRSGSEVDGIQFFTNKGE